MIESALAECAISRREGRAVVRKFEVARREAVSEAGESSAVIGAIDQFSLFWAHRNSAWLTKDEYERFFRRVEKREPLGRAQRLSI